MMRPRRAAASEGGKVGDKMNILKGKKLFLCAQQILNY
jgi:hypothetical protein